MIYVFLANGFEETEALATVDILRRAALKVTTVGIGGKQIVGAHGIAVEADITDEQATTDGLTAVVLPGGMPGAANLEASPCVQSCLDYAVAHDLWITAICAAPFVLGHKGILRGKRATCYPGYETELDGAVCVSDRVVRDGHCITGKGPGATIPFALEIVKCMVSPQKADEIQAVMQCAATL